MLAQGTYRLLGNENKASFSALASIESFWQTGFANGPSAHG